MIKSWKTRLKYGEKLTIAGEKKRLKYWIKKVDVAISLYIRKKYRSCVVCGKTDHLQCGHLISRRNMSTRFDEKNLATQCAGCNIRHNTQPQYYVNWFLDKYGLYEWKELSRRAKETKKWKVYELESLYEKYR